MIEKTYGWFPGGNYDPRRFEPDRDVCKPAEIAAWRNACEAWNRGKRPEVFSPGHQEDGPHAGSFAGGSPFGMGTYEIDIHPEPGAEEEISVERAA